MPSWMDALIDKKDPLAAGLLTTREARTTESHKDAKEGDTIAKYVGKRDNRPKKA